MGKKYPMTYEEYEKRVIELFLKLYPKDKQEVGKERLNNLLNAEPEFIEALYEDTCFVMTILNFIVKHVKKYSKTTI